MTSECLKYKYINMYVGYDRKGRNFNFIILVQDLFRNVIPHQCIGSVWSRRDKNRDRDAATVVATIEQFNAVRLIHLFISLFSLCYHAMNVHRNRISCL